MAIKLKVCDDKKSDWWWLHLESCTVCYGSLVFFFVFWRKCYGSLVGLLVH